MKGIESNYPAKFREAGWYHSRETLRVLDFHLDTCYILQ